ECLPLRRRHRVETIGRVEEVERQGGRGDDAQQLPLVGTVHPDLPRESAASRVQGRRWAQAGCGKNEAGVYERFGMGVNDLRASTMPGKGPGGWPAPKRSKPIGGSEGGGVRR